MRFRFCTHRNASTAAHTASVSTWLNMTVRTSRKLIRPLLWGAVRAHPESARLSFFRRPYQVRARRLERAYEKSDDQKMVREIIKHLRIYGMLVRMNVMSQMEYRANFITGMLMELGYLVVKILYVLVAFRAGRRIAGFSPDEILVFVGKFVLVTGFYAGVFMM